MTKGRFFFRPLVICRLLLSAFLCLALVTSCGDSKTAEPEPKPQPVPPDPDPDPEPEPEDTVYVDPANYPDITYYLFAPPTPEDENFVDDKLQWEWGKTQRSTNRGELARIRMGRTPAPVRLMLAGALGLDIISDEATPALSRLLTRSYWTGCLSTAKAKSTYNRKRPFVEFGETPWYAEDAQDATGSFASATTAGGWAASLAFAEMWPPLQNAILRLGFLFGEDRVISGSNYQSDVTGGYLCGSAAIAYAHNNTKLQEDIAAAREEYKRLKGLSIAIEDFVDVDDPIGTSILNPPVFTYDYRFESDLARYYYAKSLRTTIQGKQAVQDINAYSDNMTKIFGEILLIKASEETTPGIYALVEKIRPRSIDMINQVKYTYFRNRPYVELDDPTPVPDKEYWASLESSYPSGHSCLAWSVALALAEAIPERGHQLLYRGLQFGFNRAIVGFHWATDIEAARLLACGLIARLHADPDFNDLIQQARADYLKAISEQ